MSTTYQGNSTIRETAESPQVVKAAANAKRITKRGKYADLAAAQPLYGAEVDGMMVESSTLERRKGNMGELTINLVPLPAAELVPAGAKSAHIEIEMAQLEKPLATNPKLLPQGSGTTQTAIDEVEAWRNSPQQRKRHYQIPKSTLTREPDPDDSGDWENLTGHSLTIAKKIAAGIESWLAFYPVVTRISIYDFRPSPANYGKRQTPPVTVAGFSSYLKTADRIIQLGDRSYQRTEQWTGSEQWDTDLYASAGGGS